MLVWILLIVYLFGLRGLLGKLDGRGRQRKYLIAAGIGCFLVMGLRFPYYAVAKDLQTYVAFYELAGKTPWSVVFTISEFEYGYVALNKLLALVVPWGQFIVIVEAAICVFAVGRYIYLNSEYPFEAMLYYVTLGTMSFQLTGFRQAIAISVCLLSIESAKRRRPLCFALLVGLATLFHRTAIVFAIMYFFLNRDLDFLNSVRGIVLVLVGSLAGGFLTVLGNSLFGTDYWGTRGNQYGGVVPAIIFALTIALAFWHRRRIKNHQSVNMTTVGLAIYLMRYVTHTIQRIAFYFTPGVIVALPEAVRAVEDRHLVAALQVLSLSGAVGLFVYRLTTSEWAAYRFFWQ